MAKKIDDVDIVIFDTETTGLEPESGDRVIEIAAVKFRGNFRAGSFDTLVNPGRKVSAAAFAVNRISDEMLKDAPGMQSVAPKFLEFVKGSCLCSYNAPFDMGFLENELKLCGLTLPADIAVIDALKMSRRLLPGLERYALWFVADRLGIKNPQAHRALADVEMTIGVFHKLKEAALNRGIEDFEHLLGLFSINKNFLQDAHLKKIAELTEAINLGLSVRIKYLSSSGGEVSQREVVPKEIKKDGNYSYLVGYCCLKREERTFRVDGILHLEILQAKA